MINPFKLAFAISGILLVGGLGLSADEKITFVDDVKPIFRKRCAACHNGNRQSGGLDLTNFTNMMQGGSSGGSIEPGDSDNSYLYLLITHEESPEMPPNGNKIPDQEIAIIKNWIDAGALENKTSIASAKKKKSFAMASPVGVRPEKVAFPWRMSLQPFFQSKQARIANAIAISPWAPLFAIGGSKQILLYDTESLRLLGFLPMPEGNANDIKFSRDGSLVIAGGGRHGLAGKVIGWDVQTTKRIFEIGDELDNVLAADISANLQWVALGGPQKMLRVYSTNSESLVYEIKKHTDWITNISFSPDGVLLASADRSGGLHLWEAESGNEYLTLGGHSKSVNGISWRSDSNVVATCSDDGTVKLWEVENGRQIKSWSAHNSVAKIDFARNGKLLTTGRDRKVKIWQQDGKLIRELNGLGESGISIAFCNQTDRVFVSNYAGKIQSWQIDNPKSIGSCEVNPQRLESLLQSEQRQITSVDTKLKPLHTKLNNLKAEVQQLNSSIKSREELRDRFASELAQIRNQRENVEVQIEGNQQGREALALAVEKAERAAPAVTESLDKAIEASKILSDDSSLHEIIASLKNKHDALKQKVADGRQELAATDSSNALLATERSNLDEAINAKESELGRAKQRLTQLQSELEPKQKNLEQLQNQVDRLQKRIESHQKNVTDWTNEIQFSKELKNKQDQRKVAQQLVVDKERDLAVAKQELAAAQSAFQKQKTEKDELEAKATAIDSAIREFRKRKDQDN